MSIADLFAHQDGDLHPVAQGCGAIPQLWFPAIKLQRPDTFVGCRWVCAKCGLEGREYWGRLDGLADLVREAEAGFRADEVVYWNCAPGV